MYALPNNKCYTESILHDTLFNGSHHAIMYAPVNRKIRSHLLSMFIPWDVDTVNNNVRTQIVHVCTLCTYSCMYICTYVFTVVCTYNIYMCTHSYIYICTHSYIQLYSIHIHIIHMYVCTVCTQLHVYNTVYTYVCTYAVVCIHTGDTRLNTQCSMTQGTKRHPHSCYHSSEYQHCSH